MVSASFRNRWLNHSTVVVFAVVAFIVGAVAWSFWAELDQVSRAPGQVIPTGRIQVIQSTDGGQIEKIFVREGDKVEKGQQLVQLEDVKLRASVAEAQGKVASLMSTMARINAELFDRPLAFPPEVKAWPEFVNNQTLLYTKRRQALDDQVSALRQMLGLMKQELNMNMPLLEQGDVSRADVLRLQRSVSDIESQIVNVRNKYLSDLQTEYTKTEEDLVTAREVLAQRTDALSDTKIYAPVDGIVKNIKLTTLGGVLRPSDEVMSIVPTGDELIVEAKMSPKDVAFVRVGQKASVKFDAYDAGIYGSANGEVIYISPDTLTEQTQAGEQVYYRVHVQVDTSPMKPHLKGEQIEIQPGMTATAEILTGKNTVWHYLTKPINKTMGEAMTER
ncbi:secretion protein [Novosphingobium sp. PC22D]|uniref:HlyD family type I secretion periplasmic adaptor subunit n=1 Tax=Novosphingobium sp. PC22D TaxID=1962403 RepID=UPI000BFB0ABB|nr:HlyD family type I secretion periplasmic adaptor subunit [Novosphingobium sp. PC22D]PEQ12082.1 secretion protein [Novosphingobium sp. PC22D]